MLACAGSMCQQMCAGSAAVHERSVWSKSSTVGRRILTLRRTAVLNHVALHAHDAGAFAQTMSATLVLRERPMLRPP